MRTISRTLNLLRSAHICTTCPPAMKILAFKEYLHERRAKRQLFTPNALTIKPPAHFQASAEFASLSCANGIHLFLAGPRKADNATKRLAVYQNFQCSKYSLPTRRPTKAVISCSFQLAKSLHQVTLHLRTKCPCTKMFLGRRSAREERFL